MTEFVMPDLPAEYAHFAVRDVIHEIGVAGLLPMSLVDNILNVDPGQMAPITERFMTHAGYMAQLMRKQMEIDAAETKEELEQASMPMNGQSRRFVGALIGADFRNKRFWSAAAVRQGQASAFAEEAIEDYVQFRTRHEGLETRMDGIRLYVAGEPDEVIQAKMGVENVHSIAVFRSRFYSALRDNHLDGVHTLRRQFLGHLDKIQVHRLTEYFSEFFARSVGNPEDRE